MKRSVFVGAKPTDKNRKKPLKTDKDDLSVYIPVKNQGSSLGHHEYFTAFQSHPCAVLKLRVIQNHYSKISEFWMYKHEFLQLLNSRSLAISSFWSRNSEDGPARTFTVKGALLGTFEPSLEICDTFEVPSDPRDPVSYMDLEFLVEKIDHLNEVTSLEVVGWYVTSIHTVSQHDLAQTKMVFDKIGDSSIVMMKVDPFNVRFSFVVFSH